MAEAHIAGRMAQFPPFHVMAILARAKELEAGGRDIVHMEVGEPDFDSTAEVVAAGVRALEQGHTHYTPATGLPQLRQAIADFYGERYATAVDPARVVVTPGGSGAIQLIMTALLNPGDMVLLPDPGYPCNRQFVQLAVGEPVSVPCGVERDFRFDAALAEEYWDERTVAAMIASPANPTGAVTPREVQAELARFCASRGGYLIVDEIYHGLSYGDEAPATAYDLGDNVFVINSFSKYFGMTGWRIGWLLAPEAFIEPIERLAQNIFLAPSTPAQYAALACFSPGNIAELESRREAFRERRDYLLPALRELGFKVAEPAGAFYLYADCSAFSDDSFDFCTRLLEEAGVAATPGIDFGRHQANTHLRFAYTTSLPRLQEGVARIRAWLAR